MRTHLKLVDEVVQFRFLGCLWHAAKLRNREIVLVERSAPLWALTDSLAVGAVRLNKRHLLLVEINWYVGIVVLLAASVIFAAWHHAFPLILNLLLELLMAF